MRAWFSWFALFLVLMFVYMLSPWPMGGLPRVVSQTLLDIQCPGRHTYPHFDCQVDHVFLALVGSALVASSSTCGVLFLVLYVIRRSWRLPDRL
jgi:hypothetical protein